MNSHALPEMPNYFLTCKDAGERRGLSYLRRTLPCFGTLQAQLASPRIDQGAPE